MKSACSLVLPVVLLVLITALLARGDKSKFSCSASNPQGICNAAATCGSASAPCKMDIRRSGSTEATATPDIPNAKANKPFCLKAGTPVTFYTSSKNTGFVIDFGRNSPFDNEGAIMGGADRSITVVAKRPGCYRYSVGACTAGAIYGMCGNIDTELVVSAAN